MCEKSDKKFVESEVFSWPLDDDDVWLFSGEQIDKLHKIEKAPC